MKKDELKKLRLLMMYNISKASFVSLFMFLIIFYLSTVTSFKSSIEAFGSLTISIFIFGTFLITLTLLYIKIPRDKLIKTFTKLKKLYPEVPSIIMGIGFSLLLITFLVVINIPPKAPSTSTYYGLILMGLMAFGFILIPIGFFLLIVSLFSKKYLENSWRTDWIFKNKDTIFQAIGVIVPIILFILSLHYQTLPPNVP